MAEKIEHAIIVRVACVDTQGIRPVCPMREVGVRETVTVELADMLVLTREGRWELLHSCCSVLPAKMFQMGRSRVVWGVWGSLVYSIGARHSSRVSGAVVSWAICR